MTRHMKTALLATGALAVSGALAVRADGSDELTELFTGLSTGFEEFKATMAEKSQNIEKRFDDVVTTEKLDRINADIGKQQEKHEQELAKISASLSSLELNGVGDGANPDPAIAEYNANFDNYIRTGAHDAERNCKAEMKTGVMAAMTVGSDPDGGLTAPVEWDRQITDKLMVASTMRRHATVTPVSGQGFRHVFNKRGMDAGWVGEGDPRTATATSQLADYEYKFGGIYAFPGISEDIIDDSEINIEQFVADEVEARFVEMESLAFVSGDGSKKPKGVMMYTAALEGALDADAQHPLGPITEVVSGNASLLTADGLVDLLYDVPAERLTTESAFYANRKTHADIRKMKDGQGNFLWQPPFQADQPATILGQGARTLEGMPDIAANAMPVLFGDLSRGYRIFDRVGVKVSRHDQTNPGWLHLYIRKRVGGGLWNPEWLRYHKIAA